MFGSKIISNKIGSTGTYPLSMLKYTKEGDIVMEPNAPKERYTCHKTGAHFKFEDICTRLLVMERERSLKRF